MEQNEIITAEWARKNRKPDTLQSIEDKIKMFSEDKTCCYSDCELPETILKILTGRGFKVEYCDTNKCHKISW